VASSEGELVLPEQRVVWWNVNSGQWKEAILPSEVISVAANTTIKNDKSIEQLTAQAATPSQNSSEKSHWLWPFLAAVLGLICLVQAWFIFQLKKQPVAFKESGSNQSQNLSQAKSWKALRKALSSSEPQNIRQAILTWGQSFTESRQLNTLDKIAEYSGDVELNAQLKKVFNALEASLYKDDVAFDAQGLEQQMTLLKDYIANDKRKASDDASELKPLYKS